MAPMQAPNELAWMAEAIGDATVSALIDANAAMISPRQFAAAMEQLELREVTSKEARARLRRQVGARFFVTAALEPTAQTAAAQGDVTVKLVIYDSNDQNTAIAPIVGSSQALHSLCEQSAQAIVKHVDPARMSGNMAPRIRVDKKAKELWQDIGKARSLLAKQSLAPRAADPAAPPMLGKAELESASNILKRAVQKLPNDAEINGLLGLTLALQGKAEQAQHVLHPKKPRAFHQSAVLSTYFAALRAGRRDVAEHTLHNALTSHPLFLHARGTYAELLTYLGRLREARGAYEIYLAGVPQQPWVMSKLGYIASRMRQYDVAIDWTQRALQQQPGSVDLTVELASRYIDAKRFSEARQALEQARQAGGDSPALWVRLGYIALLEGNDAAAIDITTKALQQQNIKRRDHAYAQLNLARAYGHLGQLQAAAGSLQKALELGVPSIHDIEDDPKLAALRASSHYATVLGIKR